MSTGAFLAAFLAIPTVFVALDLVDHRWSRRDGEAPADESPGWETLLFLLAVFVVYGAIQMAGTKLAPSAPELMEGIRVQAARLLHRPLDAAPLGGGALAIACVAIFYLLGLWDYVLHRWFSHSPRFFFTHEYHHLPNHVTVTMPGMGVRPFAVVTSFPATFATVVSAYALLAVLGLPLWDLAPLKILILVHALLLTTSHSSFLRRWWWVHHAMKWLALTTPQEHVLHHTVDLRGNYGNFTVLWDRVFRTYLDPTRSEHQGHALGLPYDQDFLGAITGGWIKLPRSVRRRFRLERYCNIDEG
jgi:sterol desaturase/sphingolipid hydroxylase (fatty acid hydroxylase superfamily)